MYIIYS